ncbi:hypothetical protein DB35_16070 [Streptomyces abyssalis]|uniref:Uncharacterized protein n=1 Tax=Streptomyces abyssalis TaxID=933944 RepID=A0A1E7JK19_9ACTN|nr:hypothetical protein [Streptomyces abyssalis]OEU87990.1 hypothetical protein AN215_17315 [Streptomyces abyssalis]OEU90851.1 hypothetical protein DB35_16070 [Streptomyces abyssalis]OEV29763.1 hypothetical protein AN219_14745 [Streptomyces nanshensis]
MTPTSRGWRIDRVPAKPVRRAEDGRVSVPLWLLRDGVYHSDLDLHLSPSEAELLHAQLSHALDDGTPVPPQWSAP